MKTIKTILITITLAFGAMAVAPAAEAGIFDRKGECGIKVVSYRVQGEAGQSFEYAGKAFEIPMHGTIEIIADKKADEITTDGRVIELASRPANDFGIVDVDLDREVRTVVSR
ncbi:MAG: hypothetical protein R3338_15135 [Thermoanaerobaculia bacterium]|nr:hypothetical protein [Thermoanaerobaculia bacterium]